MPPRTGGVTRPIGYYVHHQGAGHLHRARLINAASSRSFTLMGTFESEPDVLCLPDDRLGVSNFSGHDGEAERPHAFHYAPLAVAGVRDRMARIADWIAAQDPALFIVDVSVEVALFVRLMAVPVMVVRLAGLRDDPPHLEAFRAAEALLAPFPEAFENEATPQWVRDKTIYAGLLAPGLSDRSTEMEPGVVVVVVGRGGLGYDAEKLAAATAATHDYQWHVYGPTTGSTNRDNLHFHGWVADLDGPLDRAEIIVGGAGDGLLAEVAARGKRFICLPEDRAFGEQRDKGATLARLGCAVTLEAWPDTDAWPAILREARAIDPQRLRTLTDPSAVARTALAIETIVRRFDPGLRG